MLKNSIYSLIFVGILSTSLLFSSTAYAIDPETKELSNQTMLKIYDEIILAKLKYPDLKKFDKSALKLNAYGIYTIQYKFEDQTQTGKNKVFEFAVTIVGLNDPNVFGSRRSTFDLSFPLLDLRFTGYVQKTFNTRQFNIEGVVQKHGQLLWDHQQKFMPYQLKLTAVKPQYKVGEDIEFSVTLRNKTAKNIIVKDLSANTLFFLYNDKTWGAVEVNPTSVPDKQIILESGHTIQKTFRGPAMKEPVDFEIYASYGLTYEGIKPSDTLKIKVVP